MARRVQARSKRPYLPSPATNSDPESFPEKRLCSRSTGSTCGSDADASPWSLVPGDSPWGSVVKEITWGSLSEKSAQKVAADPNSTETESDDDDDDGRGDAAFHEAVASIAKHEGSADIYPAPNYLEKVYGKTFGPLTRCNLIRQLFSLSRTHNLPSPVATAILAANYLDRFLSLVAVRPESLAGAASSCLAIASKNAHGTARRLEIDDRMEIVILQALRWRLVVPTACAFLPLFAGRFGVGPAGLRRAEARVEYFTKQFESLGFHARILALAAILSLDAECLLSRSTKKKILDHLAGAGVTELVRSALKVLFA